MIFFQKPKYKASKLQTSFAETKLDPDFCRDEMNIKLCLRTRLDPDFRRDDMRYKRCLYLMSIVQSAGIHNRLHITFRAQHDEQITHHRRLALIIEVNNIFVA
jgi:hypothetical protein